MWYKTLSTAISCLVIAGINFLPLNAKAQGESMSFTRALTSGSGCRPNKQVISPDGRAVSILLDNFIAENGKKVLCNVKLRATVPNGFFLQEVNITYQGFQDIQAGGTGYFQSSNLGSKTAGGVNVNFNQGADIFIAKAPFTVESKNPACKSATTDVGVQMTAFASKGSMVALDTVDLEAGKVIFEFQVVPCQPKR